MDEKGNVVRSRKVTNLRSEVEEFLEGVKDCRAVIEAGRSSYTLIDLLDELGVKVTMAHPKEVKLIAKAKVKTDKRDSQLLAHLLLTDLVPEVYQRSKENREVQKILRQRVFYVEAITRVKNRVHALIAQPMGFTHGNLPAGLQIVGRLFGEPELIKVACAYEQATKHRRPPEKFPGLE